MFFSINIIIPSLLLLAQAQDPVFKEDCTRNDRACNNVPCDSTDGSCTCPTGMSGSLCQYINVDAITGCGGIFTEATGDIVVPPFYLPDLTCIFLISVPSGNRIVLSIQASFNNKDAVCSRDSVEVRNGGNAGSDLFGKYCDHGSPITLTSNSNEMWMKFVSDAATLGGQLVSSYTLIDAIDAPVTFDNTCPLGTKVISTSKYLELESLDADTPAAQILAHTATDYSGIGANIECVNVCTDADMTGDDCTTKRVDFSCDMTTGITIANIEPPAPYGYDIKIYGKDACVYSAGVVWAFDINACLSLIEHPDDRTALYKFVLHIPFSDTTVASNDILLTLICQLTNGVTTNLDPIVSSVTVDSSDLTQASDQIVVDDKPVATLVISANAGTAGGDVSSLNVGQDFYLVISMPRSVYVAFLIEELVVASGNQFEVMVKNGCWTDKAIKFIKEIVTTGTSSTDTILSLRVTAFKFTLSNELNFIVNMLLCTTSQSGSSCELKACVARTNVAGTDIMLGHNGDIARRKRDVHGGSEAVHSGKMSVSVKINQPGQATADGQSQNVSQSRKRCFQDVIILAPMVTLLALLLLSMGTSIYFCSKVNRRNKADPSDDYGRSSRGYPMSESGRSGHSSKYPGRY